MRILIADDNADLRESLRLFLEHAGYAVALAADGREALAAQHRFESDVLITDIFMPESDGFETITAFRRAFPRTRIIVISGDSKLAKLDYLKSATLIGADATLRKPFEPQALLDALRKLAPR